MQPKPRPKPVTTASSESVQRFRRRPAPYRPPASDLASIDTKIPIFGDASAPILFVLDPVVGNVNAKQPFDKRQFEWLIERLKQHGKFSSNDVIFMSCAPPVSGETWAQNKLIGAHLKAHYQEFHKILEAIKPRLIIPAGAKACQQVVGRAVQITKVRGQTIKDDQVCHGIPVLPVLSPFYAQRHPELESVFNTDIQTAARLFNNDYDLEAASPRRNTNYRWCWDLKPLLIKKPKRLSVDVETRGLRPYAKGFRLLTVQLSWKAGHAISIPIDYNAGDCRHFPDSDIWHRGKRSKLIKQLRTLLEDPEIEIVGQNFKFDWLCLKYYLGIEVKNYTDDSILLAHLHDENVQKQNIDDLVRIHVSEMAGYNDPYNNDPEHQGKKRMDLLSPEKMLQYGCGDPDAALRLVEALRKVNGEDPQIMNCYDKVSMPAMRAFCHIEQNGFPIDVKALRDFEKMLAKHQRIERTALLRMIPKSIRDVYRDTGVGLKPDRQVILKAYLYEHEDGLKLTPVAYTKTGQPSTSSKTAMPYYAADSKFVARIIDYIKNQRLLTTYVRGFYKYIVDGKIRPSYLLHGTVTGRTSSRDPNGQNFPKRGKLVKAYRKIFKAMKGWVFLSCDLSQAELRIAAMMSGDETMLDVYANDGDIHVRTAMGILGLETLEEWNALSKDTRDLKRFQAKAVNFGFLYGMWWKKFRSYAKTEYGIDFTEEEAKEIRELFFRTYPRLENWHEDVSAFAIRNGFVRTYDGRVRHLPMVRSNDDSVSQQAARQAINSPVQSMASDLGLIALGRLIPFIIAKKLNYIKICGFIHDAIVVLVREDKVAEAAALIKKYMENSPLEEWFGWSPSIPIKADAEIGRTLAKTYELKSEWFEGEENQHKSYQDLLEDFASNSEAKAAKSKDVKDKLYLLQAAEDARADGTGRVAEKITLMPEHDRAIRVRPRPQRLPVRGTIRRLRLAPKKSMH